MSFVASWCLALASLPCSIFLVMSLPILSTLANVIFSLRSVADDNFALIVVSSLAVSPWLISIAFSPCSSFFLLAEPIALSCSSFICSRRSLAELSLRSRFVTMSFVASWCLALASLPCSIFLVMSLPILSTLANVIFSLRSVADDNFALIVVSSLAVSPWLISIALFLFSAAAANLESTHWKFKLLMPLKLSLILFW